MKNKHLNKYNELIHQIDILLKNFINCRAYFPSMTNNLIGKKNWRTAELYKRLGFNINFIFSKPLTSRDIKKVNDIGHWLNECFIERLYALLQSYGVVSDRKSINNQLLGHNEIDILRRLRNIIAHTLGRYNSRESKERELYERIVNHFSVNTPDSKTASQFPLSINRVLIPLTKGCKSYVQALARKQYKT